MTKKNGKTPKSVKQTKNKPKRKAPKTAWKPGQSGNPKGRPPAGWSWAELLREAGEEIDKKSGKPFKELVSKKLWKKCMEGDVRAIKELMNRMDGMPLQKVEAKVRGDLIVRQTTYKKKKK